jgi:hypothetical protein
MQFKSYHNCRKQKIFDNLLDRRLVMASNEKLLYFNPLMNNKKILLLHSASLQFFSIA